MVAGRRGERMAGDGCDWPRWALSLCVLRSRQASTSLSWCAMQPSSAPMLPCACIDHAALTNVPTARIFGFVYPSHIGSHAAGTVYTGSRPALSSGCFRVARTAAIPTRDGQGQPGLAEKVQVGRLTDRRFDCCHHLFPYIWVIIAALHPLRTMRDPEIRVSAFI